MTSYSIWTCSCPWWSHRKCFPTSFQYKTPPSVSWSTVDRFDLICHFRQKQVDELHVTKTRVSLQPFTWNGCRRSARVLILNSSSWCWYRTSFSVARPHPLQTCAHMASETGSGSDSEPVSWLWDRRCSVAVIYRSEISPLQSQSGLHLAV